MKKIFVAGLVMAVCVMLVPQTAGAATLKNPVQVLMGGNNSPITSNSANRYTSLMQQQSPTWGSAVTSGSTGSREIAQVPGTLRNFTIRAKSSFTQGSYTATVLVNATATSITCTITFPATSCTDSTHAAVVAVGQGMEVRVAGSGSPDLVGFSTAIDFSPKGTGILAATTLGAEPTSTYGYAYLGNRAGFSAIDSVSTQSLFPLNGTLSAMLFNGANSPGGSGSGFTFSIRKNQATTTLTCTLTDPAVSCSDSTHAIQISDGDLLNMVSVPNGTPGTTGATNGLAFKFVPQTIGDFFFFSGTLVTGNEDPGSPIYLPFSGGQSTTTQADVQQVANAMTIKKVDVSMNAAPGNGTSRTYTLEKNGVATPVTCTVANTSKSCTWSGSYSIAQGDVLDYVDTSIGSPTASSPRISTAAYRAEGGTTIQSNTTSLNSGLIGYWTFDGKDTNWATGVTSDISGQNHPGTLISLATTTAAVVGKVGQALSFNGSTSYVNQGVDMGFRGNISITVSAWYKATGANSGNFPAIVDFQSINSGSCLGLYFTIRGNQPAIDFGGNRWRATAALSQNKWYHVVVTKSPGLLSTTSHIYVNGVEVAGAVENGDCTPNVSAPAAGGLVIGRLSHTIQYVQGVIDDVRIYNRTLSASEVSQLYKLGQTGIAQSASSAGNANNIVGWWTFDGSQTNWNTNTTRDSSGSGNTGTLVSMSTTTSPVAGKAGQALSFNGTSNYVVVNDAASLNSSNITLTGWFKFGAVNSTYQTMVAKWFTGTQQQFVLQLNSDNKIGWWTGDGSTGGDVVESSTTPVAGKWYFIAVTISGTSKKIYINGALDNSGTGTAITSAPVELTIGSKKNSGGSYFEFFQGAMDGVRIYNRTLSATEVTQLYNASK
jgi:hypothetical protein